MTVYENYNVIAFKSCIQKFTVYDHRKYLVKLPGYNSYKATSNRICPRFLYNEIVVDAKRP